MEVIADGAGSNPRLNRIVFGTGANVPVSAILDNWRTNCARPLPWLEAAPEHRKVLSLVGGGPSLVDTLPGIRERKRLGQKVWALNNSWRLLQQHGVRFDAILLMDARPENAEFVKDGPDVDYYIAAMCHPSVFEALEGKRVFVWHPDQAQQEERAIMEANRPERGFLIPGGGFIGLRALILAFVMGYRKFHLYGYDSCVSNGRHHAYPQSLNDNDRRMQFYMLGKYYEGAPWMGRQTHEFKDVHDKLVGHYACSIVAHGAGMLPDLCRHLNQGKNHGSVAA